MDKKQHGFTLVTVLILTSMASLIVLSALRENIVQERLSGNFQKKMNSRLLAEKGVFEEARLLQQALAENNALDIDGLINAAGNASGYGVIGRDATYSAQALKNAAGELEIVSLGQRYGGDAQSNLVARYKVIPGKASSAFNNALVGCKGVTLSGSGTIDSYDSSKGTYQETKSNQGDVSTIDGNADVTLSGHSPIKGDVKASGVVYLTGSSPVEGNIYANGGVDISAGVGVRVAGNVYTQGDYKHKGGRVLGVVRANGNAEMDWGAQIENTTAEDDINYGGRGTFKDKDNHQQKGILYSDGRFNKNPHVEAVVLEETTASSGAGELSGASCDPINLPNKVSNLIKEAPRLPLFSVGANQAYTLTTKQGAYTKNGNGTLDPILGDVFLFNSRSQNHLNAASNKEYVYSLSGVTLSSDAKANISGGDVIMVIDGDFKMDGAAELTIQKGSSLTVLTTGKINIGAGARIITEQDGLTQSGHPSLSFYTSFTGTDGVVLDGASSMYAAIYAPLTKVKLLASGELFGTVRGSEIIVSGAGNIHFDAGLLNVQNNDELSSPSRIAFLGWSYTLPENTSEDANKPTS